MPPPKKLHLVSQALLRRFADERGLLASMSVRHRTVKLVGPDGLCWTRSLSPQNPETFEAVWKKTEDRLPELLNAVESQAVLGDQKLVDLLRDCLAVHWARSNTLPRLLQLTDPLSRRMLKSTMLHDPKLRAVFRERHRGLWPAGPESLSREADDLLDRASQSVAASGFVAELLMDNYNVAKERAYAEQVEIGIAEAGEFLIGDAPAQSLKAGHGGVGPLGGVPWAAATTIVLPLGRRHMMSLGSTSSYISLDQPEVDYLNRVQIATAQDHVMWHPDADLRSFVSSALDQMKPAHRHA